MESTSPHPTPQNELCEKKAADFLRSIEASNSASNQKSLTSRLLDPENLQENTRLFLRVLLEERSEVKANTLDSQQETFNDLLTEAFTNTYSYLLTPLSFVPEFLSFGSSTLHTNVKMLSRLDALLDYSYFPEMLREWLTITSRTMTPEDRKLFIRKFLFDVERTVINFASKDSIAEYLVPLYEFHGTSTLDLETAKLFISDKGLTFPGLSGTSELGIEELSGILQQAYLESDDYSVSDNLPPIPAYDSFLKELREIGVVLPTPQPHAQENGRNVLPPLEMFITSKLRKKCIEKIFHENENEFKHSLELLNEIDDYQQAELNLNTLLHIHKVKSESKVARRLTEALRLRFGLTQTEETN